MAGMTGFDAWGDGPPVSSVGSNITFRTCYISHDSSKMCSAAYVRAWLASGRHIVFNFEDSASISGRDGAADARFAADTIASVYGFHGVPCIWSADTDMPDPSVADSYARAWASAFGADKTGPYGEAALINYCVDNGISRLGWLTMSHDWTGGNDPTNADIVQGSPGTIGGVSIDWDTLGDLSPTADGAPAPDSNTGTVVPNTPTIQEDDDMQQIEPVAVHPGLYNFPTINKSHFRLTVGDADAPAVVRVVAWDANAHPLVLCGDNNDGFLNKGAKDFRIDPGTVSHVTVERTDGGDFPIGVTAF